MANIESADRSLLGEMLSYGFRHPIKALGNTVIAVYGVHLAREWGGHILNGVSRQLETREQEHGEDQADQQIDQ